MILLSGLLHNVGGLRNGGRRAIHRVMHGLGFPPAGSHAWHVAERDAVMKNVEMTVEGSMLTIKVDLSKEFGPSASGKTIIIASTEGNVTIPNREEKVGLNVYRKK